MGMCHNDKLSCMTGLWRRAERDTIGCSEVMAIMTKEGGYLYVGKLRYFWASLPLIDWLIDWFIHWFIHWLVCMSYWVVCVWRGEGRGGMCVCMRGGVLLDIYLKNAMFTRISGQLLHDPLGFENLIFFVLYTCDKTTNQFLCCCFLYASVCCWCCCCCCCWYFIFFNFSCCSAWESTIQCG